MAHNSLQQQRPGRNAVNPTATPKNGPAGADLNEVEQLHRLIGNEGVGHLVGGLPNPGEVDQAANDSFQAIVNRPIIQPKLQVNQPNDLYEQEADQMAGQVMASGKEQGASEEGVGLVRQSPIVNRQSIGVQRLMNSASLEMLAGPVHRLPGMSATYKAVLKSLEEYHQLPPLADPAGTAVRLTKLAQLKQQANILKTKKEGETRKREAKQQKVQSKAQTMNRLVSQIESEEQLGQMILQHQQNPNPEIVPELVMRLRRWIDNPQVPDKDRTAGQLLYMRVKSGDADLIHNVQGGLPAGEADFSDKGNQQPIDRYVITLAVSQENADWLESVEALRNQVIKKAITSPITLAQKAKGGKFEEYAAESVLKKRESWAVKDQSQRQQRLEEFTKGIHQVGHTWVRLATYAGGQVKDLHSYGFWPQKVYNPDKDEMEGGYAGFRSAGPGQVRHPDTEHEGDSNKMYYDYPVQQAQYQRALALAQERQQSPPPYVLTDYNCTKFAQELMTTAGLGFPGGGLLPGHIFTPGKVYHALTEMMKQGDAQAYADDPLAATVKEVDEKASERAVSAREQAQLGAKDMDFYKPKSGAPREAQTLYAGRRIRWGNRPDQVNRTRFLAANQPIRFIDDDDFSNYWQREREGEKFPIVAVEMNGEIIYLMEDDYEDAFYGRPDPNAAREPVTLYAGNKLKWGTEPDRLTEDWQLNENVMVNWIRDQDFNSHWSGRGGVAVMLGDELRFVEQNDFNKARQEKKEKPAGSAIYPAGKHDVLLPAPVTLQVSSIMGNSQQMLEIAANKKYIVTIMDQLTAKGQAKLSFGMQSYLVALADLPKLGLNFGGPEEQQEEEQAEQLSSNDQAVLSSMATYSGIGSLDYSFFEQASLTKKDLTSLTPAGRQALVNLLSIDEYDLDEAINMLDDEDEEQQPIVAPQVNMPKPPPSSLPPVPSGGRPGVPPPSSLPPLPNGGRPGAPPPSSLPPVPSGEQNRPPVVPRPPSPNGQNSNRPPGPPRPLLPRGGQNRPPVVPRSPSPSGQNNNRPGVPPPRNLPSLPNESVQRSPAGDDIARQSLQNILNRPIRGTEE